MGHMSRDTNAPDDRGPGATIRLREDRFELAMRALGVKGIDRRAEFIGIDRRSLMRIRAGGQKIGTAFMAKVVLALRSRQADLDVCGLTASLDDLFEVVDEQEAAA